MIPFPLRFSIQSFLSKEKEPTVATYSYGGTPPSGEGKPSSPAKAHRYALLRILPFVSPEKLWSQLGTPRACTALALLASDGIIMARMAAAGSCSPYATYTSPV